MAVSVRSIRIPSSDGIHTLSGIAYLPQAAPKAIVHIVHGMTEHIARYAPFMQMLAKAGYVAFGYDHLGHGYTAKEGEYGYIAPKDGWRLLVSDVGEGKKYAKETFGELPYYLLGHSMGSFIVRLASPVLLPDKLIVMGTGGSKAAVGVALALIGLLKKTHGERHVSPLLDRLAFGSYNKRFAAEGDSRSWLTARTEIRKKYAADALCTFRFTVSAMGDLLRLLKHANSKEFFCKVPDSLPILLVSGEEDPVGNYGKGVRQVQKRLDKQKKNVTCILYPRARHEILNDTCAERVYADILAFLRMRS